MTSVAGASSCNSSNRFGPSSAFNVTTPVALPPGRLRLATRPDLTGSPPPLNTMGIVAVDACAMGPEGPPTATITVT